MVILLFASEIWEMLISVQAWEVSLFVVNQKMPI